MFVAYPTVLQLIQTEIQTVMKAIEKLDTEIQQLIKEGRTPRAIP